MKSATDILQAAADHAAVVRDRGWDAAFEGLGIDAAAARGLIDEYAARAPEAERETLRRAFASGLSVGLRL